LRILPWGELEGTQGRNLGIDSEELRGGLIFSTRMRDGAERLTDFSFFNHHSLLL